MTQTSHHVVSTDFRLSIRTYHDSLSSIEFVGYITETGRMTSSSGIISQVKISHICSTAQVRISHVKISHVKISQVCSTAQVAKGTTSPEPSTSASTSHISFTTKEISHEKEPVPSSVSVETSHEDGSASGSGSDGSATRASASITVSTGVMLISSSANIRPLM